MSPVTRYAKSDDVHIAYQVLGDGPTDLLFVPGFVSNVEATWQSPECSAFFERLRYWTNSIASSSVTRTRSKITNRSVAASGL